MAPTSDSRSFSKGSCAGSLEPVHSRESCPCGVGSFQHLPHPAPVAVEYFSFAILHDIAATIYLARHHKDFRRGIDLTCIADFTRELSVSYVLCVFVPFQLKFFGAVCEAKPQIRLVLSIFVRATSILFSVSLTFFALQGTHQCIPRASGLLRNCAVDSLCNLSNHLETTSRVSSFLDETERMGAFCNLLLATP